MKIKRKEFLRKTAVAQRAPELAKMLSSSLTADAYGAKKNVSRFLESLDPSSAYKGAAAGTDAFNRVLAACGIRTRSIPELGVAASTLEDVVNHPKARFLAVELIARAYRRAASKQRAPTIASLEGAAGSMINQFQYPSAPRATFIEPAISLNDVVGQTTGINAKYYKPFYLEDVNKVTARVTEGAEVPAIKITTGEKIIDLHKYGRRLDVTYEALRTIPIDLLSFFVQRIAVKVEAEKVDKVLSIIINGDGNAGTAATNYNLTTLDPDTTAGNLTLEAWLSFKMKFKNPYALTTVLGQDASILKLMLLNAGNANIPLIALGGVLSAQSVVPINTGLGDGVRAGWLDSAPAQKIVGFDRRFAVERVFEVGGQIQETDKDVKSQINSLVLTEVEGYAIMEKEASKILSLNA